MDGIYNFLADAHALYTAGLRNFVADGVNHHTGMIVVFDDHSCEILLPPCAEILVRIVVGVFMYQPVVAEFIHDIQTQPVTGIQ